MGNSIILAAQASRLGRRYRRGSYMKKSALFSLPAIFLACLFSTAHAAEEQIVIEDLTPRQLRAEIEKIQHEVYRVFNASNSDDKLDIICHDYRPTGSNIKEEACEPQFVINKRADNASDAQRGLDVLLEPNALRNILGPEFEALTEAMNAVAKESQYFRELSSILAVLRERLEEITS